MIYSADADIVPFLDGLTLSMQSYALANEIRLTFSTKIRKQLVNYQPYLLSQSLVQLICNIISLLPPKSAIKVRLSYNLHKQYLLVEVENTGINLILVNEICANTQYSFIGQPLPEGTLYRLLLPLQKQTPVQNQPEGAIKTTNDLPQFYKEIQKHLRSHFSQTEKLLATLEQSRPEEAAFMQKINTLIKVNLEDENFDTHALCKAMSLSRTQLFRRVKSLIRQAPATHIKNMRLQKAKELIETTDCTISEIAYKTGFQTLSHFTRIYKKQYGVLPSVFRQAKRPATNE
ncbi:MAG: helix-turn-helix domain-containing protein [Bacteroidetes bacterium]|nr:helix-turn-helix domain-containing protein [Bacteroidota bacterium]